MAGEEPKRRATPVHAIVLIILALPLNRCRSAEDLPRPGPQVPSALGWGDDGLLLVALRDARQVATVDIAGRKVVARRDVPLRPVSLARLDDGSTVVIGGADGEIVLLREGGVRVLRSKTGRGPTRVLSLRGERFAVSSRWDPRVEIFEAPGGSPVRSIELPLQPGAMSTLPRGRMVVADAFRGRLAAIDPETGALTVRKLDGVNLAGLAVSGDGKELLVGHVAQFDTVPVTSANIDWGLVLSSRLSAVRLSEFDRADESTPAVRRGLALDGAGHGAADPSAIAVSPDGRLVLIALAGAHQVLKNDRRLGSSTSRDADLLPLGHNQRLQALEVGRSPVALVLDPAGEFAVTADSMSDTLTVIRVSDLTRAATIRLGASGVPPRTAAQRGEALFLDGRRALDRWFSCASCHPAGHTNGLGFDTLGDGGYGAAKNTPSLLGGGTTAPFSWVGRFPTLETQVRESLQSSLRGPTPDPGTVDDLVAFVESLGPPPPRKSADAPAVRRGAALFLDRKCDSCHKPPRYTSAGTKGVGLDDGPGSHKAFNPPSLRGVGWTAPYLHDGRAPTLDAVLRSHPPGDHPLNAHELSDLKSFLESL